MIKNVYGDIWDTYNASQLFCITTGGTIVDGRLVMAGGLAEQAAKRFPALETKPVEEIKRLGDLYGSYGFLPSKSKIALFQVANPDFPKANPDIIAISASMMAAHMADNGIKSADLNFPGVGNGGLTEEDVYPILTYCFQGFDVEVKIWRTKL